MKYLIMALVLLFSGTASCQYSAIDTVFWKYSAGFRDEMIHFDSTLVESIVETTKVFGCDTITDFLHRSYGELETYKGFDTGFSDEIRSYAFKLATTESGCLTQALDNYNAKSKFLYRNSDDLINLSNYPFIEEILNHKEVYFPVLRKLLTSSSYKFKHRDDSDVFLRKNIALLLDEVARSMSLLQLESLSKNRRDYIDSLVLSQADIKTVKDSSSKFPEKL